MSRRSHFSFPRAIFLCGALLAFAPVGARADEFALIPANDPIYRQLATLDPLNDGVSARAANSNLTRYEAALQVARVLASATNAPETFSKANWRALDSLTQSLARELKSMGVDVARARGIAQKQLAAPVAAAKTKAAPRDPIASADLPDLISGAPRVAPANDFSGAFQSALSARTPLGNTAPLRSPLGLSESSRDVVYPISSRLRAGAALQSLDRAQHDLFGDSKVSSRALGASSSLAYDFNSWLTVRALAAKRDLANTPEKSPLLSAPLFAGAEEAQSTGGGLDLNLGSLRFSGDVEKFSADDRALGTRVGGGVGISAWQNRLSMSAHLSKLVPEDRAVLPSTAAEIGVGVGISERLRLNLLYQGLFTPQNNSSNERVAGGLSLSF